eukprot:TRINITY_DN43377_c0_g1_i1.p1 TRINITY_DN43377_c0_g1~~TRINITY_DN43377_c0_g1_i1.p1  ORF type:complete len:595 (-),score=96.56 TRINITY_DN43377_c0_g1_i1:96-1769(-)
MDAATGVCRRSRCCLTLHCFCLYALLPLNLAVERPSGSTMMSLVEKHFGPRSTAKNTQVGDIRRAQQLSISHAAAVQSVPPPAADSTDYHAQSPQGQRASKFSSVVRRERADPTDRKVVRGISSVVGVGEVATDKPSSHNLSLGGTDDGEATVANETVSLSNVPWPGVSLLDFGLSLDAIAASGDDGTWRSNTLAISKSISKDSSESKSASAIYSPSSRSEGVCDMTNVVANDDAEGYLWDPTCERGEKGCNADGKNLACRWCGPPAFIDVPCPRGKDGTGSESNKSDVDVTLYDPADARGFCADSSGDTFDRYDKMKLSLDACKDLCSNIKECVGLTYKVKVKLCAIHTAEQAPSYPGKWDSINTKGSATDVPVSGSADDSAAKCYIKKAVRVSAEEVEKAEKVESSKEKVEASTVSGTAKRRKSVKETTASPKSVDDTDATSSNSAEEVAQAVSDEVEEVMKGAGVTTAEPNASSSEKNDEETQEIEMGVLGLGCLCVMMSAGLVAICMQWETKPKEPLPGPVEEDPWGDVSVDNGGGEEWQDQEWSPEEGGAPK